MVFDAADPEHRYAAYQFFKTGSWANCKYQWLRPGTTQPLDMVDYITNQLLEYYANLEFATPQ